MNNKFFLLVILCSIFSSLYCKALSVYGDQWIIYGDLKTHLYYSLNKETHTAMVGTGNRYDDGDYIDAKYSPEVLSGDFTNYWWDVVIPSTITYGGITYTVTQIASGAFYECTEIGTISLPETIVEMGDYAFYRCVSLKEISLPDEIKTIGISCFEYCISLKKVKLPSKLQTISLCAFADSAIESISIPGGCTTITDDAFTFCQFLKDLRFEDGTEILSIGYSYTVDLLTNEYTTSRIKDIKAKGPFIRGAFYDCILESVYIGRNIQIHSNSFGPKDPIMTFYSIGKLTFGDYVTDIPDFFLSGTLLRDEIALPPNVKTIGTGALHGLPDHLTIPSSVVRLGGGALGSDIKVLTFVSQTMPVLSGAPCNVDALIIVPSGVGEYCREHEIWSNFHILDPSDPITVIDVKYPGSLYGRMVYEDIQAAKVYKLKLLGSINVDDWICINTMSNMYEIDMSELVADSLCFDKKISNYIFSMQMPNEVEKVSGEFMHLENDEIVIPQNCNEINNFKFYKINHLTVLGSTEVYKIDGLVNTVDLIGEGTIVHIDALRISPERLTLGKKTVLQYNSCFYCYPYELVINDGAKISSEAFGKEGLHAKVLKIEGRIDEFDEKDLRITDLEKLYIGDLSFWCSINFSNRMYNPMTYADCVFVEGKEAIDITIPNDIYTIKKYAFSGCNSVQSLTLPENIGMLEQECFYGCNNLKTILFSKGLTYIGERAFAECKSLESCEIPAFVKFIEKSTFKNCLGLKSVILPSNLTTICDSAFYACSSIQNIDFPSSTKSIGNFAFYGCESVSSIVFPLNIAAIGEGAFANCKSLNIMKGKWTQPFEIKNNVPINTFDGIASKCCLWVPYGSASKYYNAGWGHIPLIDEGFYTITIDVNEGGCISFGDQIVKNNNTDAILVESDEDVAIDFIPQNNHYVKQLLLDGTETTDNLVKNTLKLTSVNKNMELSVLFDGYVLGDVNCDEHIDVGDISAIVSYIQETPPSTFLYIAADVNEDDEVDVGDITGTVNLIYSDADDVRAKAKMKYGQFDEYELHAEPITISAGDPIVIPILLNNKNAVSGIQFEINLPMGFSIPQDTEGNYMVTLNEDRVDGMNILSVTQLANGNYQILCASTRQGEIANGSGAVLNIAVTAVNNLRNDRYEFKIENIRISDKNAIVTRLDPKEVHVTIDGSTGINNNSGAYQVKEKDGKYVNDGHIVIIRNGRKYNAIGTKL